MILLLTFACASGDYAKGYTADASSDDEASEFATDSDAGESLDPNESGDLWWRVYADLVQNNSDQIAIEESTIAVVRYDHSFEPQCFQLCQIIESQMVSYVDSKNWWASIQIKPTYLTDSEEAPLNFEGVPECDSMPAIPTRLRFGVGALHYEIRAVWNSIDWLDIEPQDVSSSMEHHSAYISVDDGESLWAYGAAIYEELQPAIDEESSSDTDDSSIDEESADSNNADDNIESMQWFLRPAFYFPI